MFDRFKIVAIVIPIVIAVFTVQGIKAETVIWDINEEAAIENSLIKAEQEIRDKLATELEELAEHVTDFDKKSDTTGDKLYGLIKAISWEEPTKERVLLMVLLTELSSIKMSIVGAFLLVKQIPYIDTRYMQKEISESSSLLTMFMWNNIMTSAKSIARNLKAYGDKELVAEFESILHQAGYIYGKCTKFLINAQKVVPTLMYLKEGEPVYGIPSSKGEK